MRRASRPGLTAPLRHRDYRLLIEGYAVSAAGSWAYNVGLVVFVYQQTRSAAWVGAVALGRFLPSILFGSYGGVLAERLERIRLLVMVDLCCAALMTGLAFLAAYHGPALAAIVIAAVNSLFIMTYEPAVAAITPQLVSEDELAAANTLYSTVTNLALIAGPALGAALLVVGDPTFVFAANAISFLWSAVIVSRISARSTPVDVTAGGTVGPLRQMLVGVRTILSSSSVTVLAAYSVAASFVYGVDTVLFVIVSEQRLGSGATGYGYLLAGLGVGGLLGAGLVKRVAAWPRLGTAIIAAMAVYCVPTLALLTVRRPVEAFVVEVVRGAGTLVVDVLAMTALQRSLPRDKLARVFGAFFTFVLIAISAGAMLTPVVLHATGLDTTLWLAGLGIPVLCLAGWPWLRRMDEANAADLAEIAPRVALLQRAAILVESSRSALENLARQSTVVNVAPGEDVVHQGDPADAFYLIESGTLKVTAHDETNEAVELASLGPGDYFGEIGLLQRIPRTATVTATSAGRLLQVPGEAFLEAVSSGVASPSLLEGAQARLARNPAYRPAVPEVPGTASPAPA
jgi:predicted MFS family arabinose efflux permease